VEETETEPLANVQTTATTAKNQVTSPETAANPVKMIDAAVEMATEGAQIWNATTVAKMVISLEIAQNPRKDVTPETGAVVVEDQT